MIRMVRGRGGVMGVRERLVIEKGRRGVTK